MCKSKNICQRRFQFCQILNNYSRNGQNLFKVLRNFAKSGQTGCSWGSWSSLVEWDEGSYLSKLLAVVFMTNPKDYCITFMAACFDIGTILLQISLRALILWIDSSFSMEDLFLWLALIIVDCFKRSYIWYFLAFFAFKMFSCIFILAEVVSCCVYGIPHITDSPSFSLLTKHVWQF